MQRRDQSLGVCVAGYTRASELWLARACDESGMLESDHIAGGARGPQNPVDDLSLVEDYVNS